MLPLIPVIQLISLLLNAATNGILSRECATNYIVKIALTSIVEGIKVWTKCVY